MSNTASTVWETSHTLLLPFLVPAWGSLPAAWATLGHGPRHSSSRRVWFTWLRMDRRTRAQVQHMLDSEEVTLTPGRSTLLQVPADPTSPGGVRAVWRLLLTVVRLRDLSPIAFTARPQWSQLVRVQEALNGHAHRSVHLLLLRPDGSHSLRVSARATWCLVLDLRPQRPSHWYLCFPLPALGPGRSRAQDQALTAPDI